MKKEIVNNLVDSSIIKAGTELSVDYVSDQTFTGTPAKMKGVFKVVRLTNYQGNYYFTLARPDQDKAIVAEAEHIHLIDGMTAERVIKAFNLAEDGKKKPRKPRRKKSQILESLVQKESKLVVE